MKLALALGWPSVEIMLNNLSYRELVDWLQYYSVEPFPEERDDFRVAYSMALLANINRDKKKKAFQIDDFLFDFWTEKQGKSSEQMADKLQHFANMFTALGGKVVKRSEINDGT